MNRYKVEICTESVLVVEACSENEAEKQALNLAWPLTGCCEELHSSHVTGTTNLSNPITLVADLACQLQWHAFKKGICRFCGCGRSGGHAKDCVLGRAHHFLDEGNELPKTAFCSTCGTALGIEWDGMVLRTECEGGER